MILKKLAVMLIAAIAINLSGKELKVGDTVRGNEPYLYVKYLGIDELDRAPELKTGYLFLAGEFIPPPYKFKRIGQAITVNGRLLNKLGKYDFEKKPEKIIFKNIKKPKPIQEMDFCKIQYLHDDKIGRLIDYLNAQRRYLYTVYDDKKTVTKKMVEMIKPLKAVESIEIGAEENYLDVYLHDKKIGRYGIMISVRKDGGYDKPKSQKDKLLEFCRCMIVVIYGNLQQSNIVCVSDVKRKENPCPVEFSFHKKFPGIFDLLNKLKSLKTAQEQEAELEKQDFFRKFSRHNKKLFLKAFLSPEFYDCIKKQHKNKELNK
jgi:hypothetical protein